MVNFEVGCGRRTVQVGLGFVLRIGFEVEGKGVTSKYQVCCPITGVFDKKGFCARFGNASLRRKFSTRLERESLRILSSQIHRTLAATGLNHSSLNY